MASSYPTTRNTPVGNLEMFYELLIGRGPNAIVIGRRLLQMLICKLPLFAANVPVETRD